MPKAATALLRHEHAVILRMKTGAGRRERLNALLDKLTAELVQTQT